MPAPTAELARAAHGEDVAIRKLTPSDITDAIKLGVADFNAKPSHLFILGLIYVVAGLLGAAWAFQQDLWPLIFPVVSGYALLGPFAAVILYEISRRREQGEDFSWSEAFSVFKGPRARTVFILGLGLLVVFMFWLLLAQLIFQSTIGDRTFSSVGALLAHVLTTREGLMLIVIGNAAGFCLAALVLWTYVVSFPIALDRDVGPITAMRTSMRVTVSSPVAIGFWGAVIVGSMLAGALVLMVGLAVILPVLGHASWHVYRKAAPR